MNAQRRFAAYLLRIFAATLDVALHCAFGIALCVVVALIVKLFTFAKSHLHLNSRPRKIERERNQGITVLRYLTEQLIDLTFVHQELFRAKRVAVEYVAFFVGTYMKSVCEKFAVFDTAIRILKICFALSQAFNFGTEQSDSRFVRVFNEIFMARGAIFRDLLAVCFLFFSHSETSLLRLNFIIYKTRSFVKTEAKYDTRFPQRQKNPPTASEDFLLFKLEVAEIGNDCIVVAVITVFFVDDVIMH